MTTNEEYLNLVSDLCAPNPYAFVWFSQLLNATLTFDHLMDHDEVGKEEVERAFLDLVLGWGLNKFFLSYSTVLVPAVAATFNAWEWSNESDNPKLKAYDLYTEIPAIMAFLLGGMVHVRKHMPKIREVVMRQLDEDERADNGKK